MYYTYSQMDENLDCEQILALIKQNQHFPLFHYVISKQ